MCVWIAHSEASFDFTGRKLCWGVCVCDRDSMCVCMAPLLQPHILCLSLSTSSLPRVTLPLALSPSNSFAGSISFFHSRPSSFSLSASPSFLPPLSRSPHLVQVKYLEKETEMQELVKDWLKSDEPFGQTYTPPNDQVYVYTYVPAPRRWKPLLHEGYTELSPPPAYLFVFFLSLSPPPALSSSPGGLLISYIEHLCVSFLAYCIFACAREHNRRESVCVCACMWLCVYVVCVPSHAPAIIDT